MSAPLRYLLWDFGDTLADQDWMLQPMPGVPDWARVWTEIARERWEADWMLGRVSHEFLARQVADRLQRPLEQVQAHMRRCCERIRYFEAVMECVRSCPLPQGIVTVNPDLFSEVVVTHDRLDRHFPVIVCSWQAQSLDKAVLGRRALAEFGAPDAIAETLLIDNVEENVQAWRGAGGQGYTFVDEARFRADLSGRLGAILQAD